MEHEFKVKFLGALGRVTGSCSLIKFDDKQYLVDCGMVQGDNDADIVNNKTFDFNPRDIEAVFLTHAHLDHCGLIPRLYKEGFIGKVWCTSATARLAHEIMLDAADIMKKNEKLKPIYDKEHVKVVQFKHIDKSDSFKWNEGKPICDDLFITPIRGSHILGSAAYSIGYINKTTNKSNNIFFSGDIGKNSDTYSEQTFLKNRQTPHPNTQYFVSESTYGGRESNDLKFKERIEVYQKLIKDQIVEKQGNILIPTFSMHRTQEILTEIVYAIETLNKEIFEPYSKRVVDGINYCLDKLNISKFSLSESRQILHRIDSFFKKNNQYKYLKDIIKECLHISLPIKELDAYEKILKEKNIDYEILNSSLMIYSISKDVIKVINKMQKDEKLSEEPLFVLDKDLNKNFSNSLHKLSLIPIELESILAKKVTMIYKNELFQQNITTKSKKSKWLNDVWKDRFVDGKFTIETLKKIFDCVEIKGRKLKLKEVYFNNCKISNISNRNGKIIITSSGMCDEGPIKSILNNYAEDENCTIIMNGYTPEGSNGNHLKKLKEYSEDKKSLFSLKVCEVSGSDCIPRQIKLKDVKAKVQEIYGYGGHADKNSLLDFIFYKDPRTNKYNCTPYFFINHGNSRMREELKKNIIKRAKELLSDPDQCNFTDIPQVYTPDHKSGWFNLVTEKWEEDKIEALDSKNLSLEIIANQKKILKELKEQKEISNKILSLIKINNNKTLE